VVEIVGLLLVFALAIAGAAWLDRRSARKEALRNAAAQRTGAALPPDAEGFLARLDDRLGLPVDICSEIHAELGDHLEDSIAALEAEGLDRERATREALARLGRPEELARQLRSAHHTTRRLLAGAGGGIVSAGIGVIQGYMLGFAFFVVASIALGTLLKPVVDYVTGSLLNMSEEQAGQSLSYMFLPMLTWPAAFLAGRRAVKSSARASHRTVRQVGWWWAIAGVAVIGYVVLFRLTIQQSWPAVFALMVIPLAFAGGALIKTGSGLPRIGWRTQAAMLAALLVVLVGGVMFATATGSSGRSWGSSGEETLAYDRVAPEWPDVVLTSGSSNDYEPVISFDYEVDSASALAAFHDLRFEAWRGENYAKAPDWVGLFVPDTRYSTPFATEPLIVKNGTIQARFDMSHVRANRWLIFVTGVASDGVRYRLNYPDSITTTFSGTAWDWLTAAE
jgi:hypothetical protein